MQVQLALWGPAEFSATGELARWNRLPDLARLTLPVLVLVGAYDYITPLSAGLLHAHLPDARLVLFPESGHSSFLDEPRPISRRSPAPCGANDHPAGGNEGRRSPGRLRAPDLCRRLRP